MFQSEKKPARDRMLSLRLTAEQDEALETLVARLKVRGKSDVVRQALDYWLAHSPEAKRALRR